jgi:hypothetical protein
MLILNVRMHVAHMTKIFLLTNFVLFNYIINTFKVKSQSKVSLLENQNSLTNKIRQGMKKENPTEIISMMGDRQKITAEDMTIGRVMRGEMQSTTVDRWKNMRGRGSGS